MSKRFLSTPSARRATCSFLSCGPHRHNFYPRPPRGGRQFPAALSVYRSKFLSTPSARRATRPPVLVESQPVVFLSTPSARRATDFFDGGDSDVFYFYPRPPRGGRRRVRGLCSTGTRFLSTPSARRATLFSSTSTQTGRISIHALREEGDPADPPKSAGERNFYPRPPRGGRPSTEEVSSMAAKFLSTPSARRATIFLMEVIRLSFISIHALREEGDVPCFKTTADI